MPNINVSRHVHAVIRLDGCVREQISANLEALRMQVIETVSSLPSSSANDRRRERTSRAAHVIPGFRVTRIESRPRRQYALRTEPSFRATAVALACPSPISIPPSTAEASFNFHPHPHFDSPTKFLLPSSSSALLFSHPIHTSLPKIASPVPVKHWSNFEAILEWQERTSDALDDGFYSDEPDEPAPRPILDAAMRENTRRRDWAAYRKVVEADPNTTIAPPWPPFVAPPSPSPSPEPSVSSLLWRDSPSSSDMGHRDLNHNSKTSPLAFANDGYAWWKYVLDPSTPSSPRGVVGAPRSGSDALASGAFSDTDGTGTSPSSGFSSGGCSSLALATPTLAESEDAGAVRAELTAAGAAGPDEDLAACIAQMLLECRVDAEERLGPWQPIGKEGDEEDPLVDGHVYDCGLEKEIRERAAIAQQLNWMLMGVVPMG